MPFDSQKRMQYGCVFCWTGREVAVAQYIQESCLGFRATPLEQLQHKRIDGQRIIVQNMLLPGYVFFETNDTSESLNSIKRVDGVLRILKDSTGHWQLGGADLRFARWVFEEKGLIGLSTARRVAESIIILEGPLKDFERQIVRIDRRSMNGQVDLRFDNHIWRIWLAFEIEE